MIRYCHDQQRDALAVLKRWLNAELVPAQKRILAGCATRWTDEHGINPEMTVYCAGRESEALLELIERVR